MATGKGQRIGIWVIAVVLVVGTFAGFIAMILAPQNQAELAAKQQADYQKMLREYQEEQEKLNRPLDGYKAEAFNADDVTKLEVDVLQGSEGKVLTKESTIKANYFGWTSDGKIFDSTNKEGSETTPIEFNLSGVIAGWTEGLAGQRVGSTVKLMIPTEKAYGEDAAAMGRPAGPLAFIVEIKELVVENE